MRNATWTLIWMALGVVGLASPASATQDLPDEPQVPGARLAVTFTETREGGGSASTSRSCTLALHADVGQSHLFVGSQAAILIRRQDAPTTIFKNVGVAAGVGATTLPDGRYRLEASFEESAELAASTDARVSGSNPIIQVVRGEARLTVRPGETVPFARAVDPVSGQVVKVDVEVTETAEPKAAATRTTGAPLQARLVLVRRQGQTPTARRPYSIVLPPGDGASEEASANVFSGSMLPVQVMANNQITVALKDVGAGMRVQARRVVDGRFRLDVEFSDGVLAPGRDGPQIRTFESQSTFFVRVGETVPIAVGVDPVTGETVEAEVTLEEAK